MSLEALSLPPDQANYTSKVGETFIANKLDGGSSRFRADQLGAAHTVSVQWDCNKVNYDYLMAFFRTAINFGVDPFTIYLILDSGTLQSYTVHILPGTFGLTSTEGQRYIVGAMLELVPDSSFYSGDSTIISAGPDV